MAIVPGDAVGESVVQYHSLKPIFSLAGKTFTFKLHCPPMPGDPCEVCSTNTEGGYKMGPFAISLCVNCYEDKTEFELAQLVDDVHGTSYAEMIKANGEAQ